MRTMRERTYLHQTFAEPTPQWLTDYKVGDPFPLRKFLKSRTAYYPGSRMDSDAFDVFCRSAAVHCLVMADYGMPESEIAETISAGWLDGYHQISSVHITEREMMAAAPFHPHLTMQEVREGEIHFECRGPFQCQPYARVVVFEREEGKTAMDGCAAERVAVLFIGGDGIATYDALFACRNATDFFGMLLRDHGFGGNWNRFGPGGLMEKIAIRAGVYPKIIYTGNPWENYGPAISGIPLNEVCLFAKV